MHTTKTQRLTSRIRSHVRGNLIAYVALFLAMSGGAYAATIAPPNSVVTKSIKNGAVKKKKIHDGAVTTSKLSPEAIAPNALNASNSDRLGGTAASEYQQRLTAGCGNGKTIDSISQAGGVSCESPVTAISHDQSAGHNEFDKSPFSPLQIVSVCHDGATVEIEFQNLSDDGATLNWMYSDGGTTVHASGTSLNGHGAYDFAYPGKRLEGQFIFASGNGVTTVHLHAWDGGTGCEVKATEEFAS